MLYNTNLCVPQNYVPLSKSLCAAEREFVLKRKQVALKSLKRLGLECTLVNLKEHVLSCLFVCLPLSLPMQTISIQFRGMLIFGGEHSIQSEAVQK